MKVCYKKSPKSARGRGLTLVWGVHDFPAGRILVALSSQGLCWLGMNCGGSRLAREWPGAELVEDAAVTKKAAAEITKLWPKRMDNLSIPVVLYGTEFQLAVWRQLLKIKCGDTVTYHDIARAIGKPGAMRAVGSAVGRNTVSLLVPCHRVVNKDGKKVNYGWGAAVKRALLADEGVEI